MPHKDPAVRRAYLQAYRVKHADRLREQRKAYEAANWERSYATWKAWCEANPDKRKAIELRARRNYEKRHPQKILNKNAARRARLALVTVEPVDRMVVYARDKGRCGICGRFVAKAAFDLDHVMPLARGGEHSYANVQVSHPICNRRKRHSLNLARRPTTSYNP